MLKVALTGGIATGKSYCLARFAGRGIPVQDADWLARDVVSPGSPALDLIARRFGPDMLTSSGELDRSTLGALVFTNADARHDLEAIVHPEVYRRIKVWAAALEASGAEPIAMADIPLLFETGHEDEFDRIVVVACRVETQRRRLRERNGLNEEEAGRRLEAQWPIAEKIARASYVVTTDGTFEDTDRQVDLIHDALLRDAAGGS